MSVAAYPEYKDSGADWVGSVPSHWTVARLSAWFVERRQKVSDADFPALSVTKNGIVPQLETAAKTDDGDNRKGVFAGDFVINSRSDRKGSSGLATRDGSVSLINTVLEPDAAVFGPFVHHLLRSVAFQEEYYRYGKGIVADLWSTNYSEMRNIRLALPPHSEQTSIAAFLDHETAKIDELVEEQRRLIALLKEKRQAVISHAVTKGLDPNAPMKDSGVEWLGEVPAHWEVAKAKRFLSVVSGFAFPSDKFSHNTEDTRLLRGINIGVGRIRWDETVFWHRQPEDGLSAFALVPGQLVIGMDRPWIGDGLRIAVLTAEDVPALLLQRVAALNPAPDVESKFLFLLFSAQAFFNHCFPDMTGVSVPHISPTQIGEHSVAMPPLAEQRAIVDFYDRYESETQVLLAESEVAIALLQERRAALISAAVTGKIDVCGLVPDLSAAA